MVITFAISVSRHAMFSLQISLPNDVKQAKLNGEQNEQPDINALSVRFCNSLDQINTRIYALIV